jgi:hypothetical protein
MFKFVAGYIWHIIQTTIHKIKVLINIVDIINNNIELKDKWKLYRRGLSHDLSKYRWSEAKAFAKVIFDLKGLTYGSEGYIKSLRSIKPSINLHYKRNPHHPQYYNIKDGYKYMSEIDKFEMIADWIAAVTRHSDGCIFKSLDINQERFGYTDKDKEWLINIVKSVGISPPS